MNEGIYRYEDRIYIVLEYDTFVCSIMYMLYIYMALYGSQRTKVRTFISFLAAASEPYFLY